MTEQNGNGGNGRNGRNGRLLLDADEAAALLGVTRRQILALA